MKKSDLATEIARRNGEDASHAADQLDSVVNGIIRKLRSGKAARLPGIGTITPGKQWTFLPERNDT
jgi:nucleoid DNA-binding protein